MGEIVVARGGAGYARLRPPAAGRTLAGGPGDEEGDDAWLLLAGPRAPRGPLGLHVAGLGPLGVGTAVVVEAGTLRVGGWRVRVVAGPPTPVAPAARDGVTSDGAWAAARPGGRDTGTPSAAAVADARARAARAALAAVPAPPAALGPGLERLADGDLAGAVARLAGLGPGLTPAGDDALAGWAAWRHACGAPVVGLVDAARGRSAPVGHAYLGCAVRGELPDVAAAVRDALLTGEATTAARRARGLRRWGASSGHALLWGMAAGATTSEG